MASIMVIGAIVVIAFALLFSAGKKRSQSRHDDIWARIPLTQNEQPLYFRLAEALPNHVILAQVAFSSLLKTRSRTTRNTFDRKVADFVVCDKAFIVVAVVELDDSSHRGREAADAKRDAILRQADYPVLRYKSIPDREKLSADIAQLERRNHGAVAPKPAAPQASQKSKALS